jgi:hypothetical protein
MRAVLATVVGPAGTHDLSLPAELPTAELLPTLIRLLGGRPTPSGPPERSAGPEQRAGTERSARGWTLLTTAGEPIPPWVSLGEHGVLHGEFIYLVAEPPLPPQLRHLQP